ncbi:glycosyltransferase family 4 protein [Rhodocyclus tenuis]|uniref:Glycosyltransferase involved in cell wall biosynthesis n=1 Tax=Rhodocyclus tenuis TaxID=1066 RepID=A0A840G4P9_RHOTE|nr:glycosyltransferase family 1 protein [Rhodocyclus tenuis]MBB4245718.1 glycosyltransferase involved in cell wall biosynthesis [Rhodocyclus tenuis]
MSARISPLDLVIVTETYPPEVNGVAMTIGRLVASLRAAGHRVRVVRPRQAADLGDAAAAHDLLLPGLPLPGYAGLRLGLPARGRLCAAWRAARPDVVHVVTEGPLGASAVSAAHALGIPVTSGFHTNFDRYSRHYGFGFLQPAVAAYLRRFHRRTRLTLTPTAALAERLAGEGLAGVRVVGRGVDCQLFDPARRSAELRRAWGLAPADGSANAASPSPGEAVALARSEEPAATGSDCADKSASADGLAVIYVGRLAAEKNLDLVLRAFVAIHERRADARLVLVGDGPWRGKLTRRFSTPASPVVFAGQRCGEDLAAHYASGDLFLFPSLTETFGNVTQEALASGLAVLAFRSAAAAELIVDGENGRTVAVGDDAAFIRAALQLAGEPAVRRRLGERARHSVIGRDWSGVAEQFANTLREAIGGD